MNINAKHFQGWNHQPGTEFRPPMLLIPCGLGSNFKPDAIEIGEPMGWPDDASVRGEIACLLAHAPALFRIAERFFSFYELHKAARGGQLGREYEALREKIMGAPRHD